MDDAAQAQTVRLIGAEEVPVQRTAKFGPAWLRKVVLAVWREGTDSGLALCRMGAGHCFLAQRCGRSLLWA